MKQIVLLFMFLGMWGLDASAQQIQPPINASEQTSALSHAEFKVYGNCMMCKKRIERAAQQVAGVQEAVWDVDAKVMKVSWDAQKATLKQIKEAIAQAGHDTDQVRAPDEAYEQLPMCCMYERPERSKQ